MGSRQPEVPDPPRALPATEVLIGRIGWLIRLRWLAIAGTFVFIELGRRFLPIRIAHRELLALLAGLTLYNAINGLVLRRTAAGRTSPDREFTNPGRIASFLLPGSTIGAHHYDRTAGVAAIFATVQIGIDLLFLAAILHFSGGLENPLWVFFVFHVIVASVLLSRPATYAIASLGTALLWSMILLEHTGRLQRYSLDVLATPWYVDDRMVAVHLGIQAITLFVAAYLASSIAGRLRRREADVMVLSWHLSEKARDLEKVCEELTAAEQAKSLYMRKVAHELRAPLGTIKSALTVVLDTSGDALGRQSRHIIERAERRVGELADMTRALLTLSRAQGGHTGDAAPVALSKVFALLIEERDARASAASLRLLVDLPPAMPVVLADGEALSDLLANLVGNAIRYTPANGTVSLRVEFAGDGMTVEVEDTGIGIPQTELPRIFDEFYRSPRARQHTPDGSGLGLAIVKAIVDRYHGRISVTSEEGKGSCFTVSLPLRVLEVAWQGA